MGPRAALRRLAGRERPGPLPVGAPAALLDVLRHGPVALDRHRAPGGALSVAMVVPQFRRGSGGHGTIAHLVRGLEARGHACSLWIVDEEGRHVGESAARTAGLFRAFFGPVRAAIHTGFEAWDGADVVVATGWQTMPAVLRRPGAGGRAYLVQDHEPEFYGTSAERGWAEWTYRQGVHCIAASPWLAGVLRERYGATASSFDLAVDHDRYRPARDVGHDDLAADHDRDRPACDVGRDDLAADHDRYRPASDARRDDLVLFYARAVTARRAVPLGLLALEELHRRRPDIELALFGEARPIATPFPHTHLGVLDPERLARAYSSAAAGLVLSLTNPSLIPLEMMACGLPCVDTASAGMLASFGDEAPISLAALDPIAVADALDGLLANRVLRAQRSRDGIEWVARRTWETAAAQVEDGLRQALREAARA